MDFHLKTNLLLSTALLTLVSMPTQAGEADVIKVEAKCQNTCTFHVTLEHADTGWEHYANKWDVLTPDGKLIATRVLHHPHVNEQPFTRSLSNVTIPDGIKQVEIRAHDLQHEYGGKTITVDLDL